MEGNRRVSGYCRAQISNLADVELYSDSKYVIDALEKGWARSWRAKGWIKSDKKPALNPDRRRRYRW